MWWNLLRMDKPDLISFIEKIFEEKSLISAILSSPFEKTASKKVTIRPIILQGVTYYQFTDQISAQALHKNLTLQHCQEWLVHHLTEYKQSFFYTKLADYQLLINKKSKMTLLKKPASKLAVVSTHNRVKQYLLQEGVPIPFLIHLGIMTEQGKIIAKNLRGDALNKKLKELLGD